MGRRVGQLTGLFLIALVLARLGRLIQSGPGLPRWQMILLASAFLGGVVLWLVRQLTDRAWVSALVLGVGGLALLARVGVPETLLNGILPTTETLPALGDELGAALRLIRSGVPPVFPEEGLLAILAMVMWLLGAVYAHGSSGGPVILTVLPAGVVYLQFAVFDRNPAGLGWMAVSGIGVALAMAAVALDRKEEVGRARDKEGRPAPRRNTATAFVMAGIVAIASIATASSASDVVSEYGNVPWRSGVGGVGPGSGGIAFDRFVDLRQRLQSRQNALLFQATLGEDAPPAGQIYWRMETLDVFDGVGWRRSSTQIRNYEPGRSMVVDEVPYQGTSSEVLQRIFVHRLAGELAPTAGTPTAIHEIDEDDFLHPRAFRYASQDASLFYSQHLRPDDIYQVQTSYSHHESDLGLLATGPDGRLTPIFANAAQAGLFRGSPATSEAEVEEPDDLEFFIELPDNIPTAITRVAFEQTEGATTDFERAWMLQHWFRDSGEFVYSTDVSTGHSSLILEDWLTDNTSRNHRTGYCEQFATAMAVLGRALDIPSRVVWGFTPGSVTTINGTEVVEVRDTNAHAWVEMWMSPVGWVRFDPTPRGEYQPQSITAAFDPARFVPEDEPGTPIDTPVAPGINDPDAAGLTDDPPFAGGPSEPRWWLLIILPLALLALGAVPSAKSIRRRARLRRIRSGDITAAWNEIVDRLGDLGEPLPPSLTPIELARSTDTALVPLAVRYSAAVYGGRADKAEESDLITAEWWIRTRFAGARRIRAALNPRSLFRGYR